MSIRIEKKWIVYESVSWTTIDPAIFLTPKDVFIYMLFNTVPKDPCYSAKDLLGDSEAEGFWTLPDEISEKMRDYVSDMMDYFI